MLWDCLSGGNGSSDAGMQNLVRFWRRRERPIPLMDEFGGKQPGKPLLALLFAPSHFLSRPPLANRAGVAKNRTFFLVLSSVGLVTGRLGGQEPLHDLWRWVQFSTESGLPSIDISRVAQDSRGTTWVATSVGAFWFDGFQWQAVPDGSVPSGSVSLVEPDDQGGVYIVSEGLLYLGNKDGFKHIPIEIGGEALPVKTLAVGSDRLFFTSGSELFQWDDGEVSVDPLFDGWNGLGRLYGHGGWVLAWGSGSLWRWEEDRWRRVFEYPADARLRVAAAGETLVIAELGTGESTLWALDGDRDPETRASRPGLPPSALTVAEDGDAVVAYEGGAVAVRKDGVWTFLDPRPAPLESIRRIQFDTDGDLWVVSESGLFVNRSSLDRWKRWDLGHLPDGHRSANALARLPNGDTWVGTTVGLVVRHPDGSSEAFSSILGRTLGPVTGLIVDRDGNLWVSSGAELEGVLRFDGREWTHFGTEQGLLAPHVHRMVLDRDGQVWFLGLGTAPGQVEPGAFVFDGKRFTRWGEPEGLIDGRVYAFAEGVDGARWFGTYMGLSRWLNGEWTHWTENDGLRPGGVFTIAVGPNGTVWFGHGPRGLGLGLLSDGLVQYDPTVDATVGARVWDIQPAGDGSLWLGTRAGLARMTTDGVRFLQTSEGLEHVLLWSVLPLEDRVLAATVGGGVYELSFTDLSDPPPRVFLEPAVVAPDGTRLQWRALAYQGLLSPGEIETRYRIDGGEWSAWGTSRELGPISLGSGSHLFEVQARGLFGDPGGIASQSFRVPPPVYLHPAFLTVLVAWILGAIGGGSVVVRRRRQNLRTLRAREAYYRSLIENASDLITVVTSDGLIHYQSPSSEGILGFPPTELAGTPFIDLVHPDDRGAMDRAGRARSAESGPPWRGLARLSTKEGGWKVLELVGQSQVQDDEGPLAVIHGRDVTDRIESEKKKEQLSRDLRTSRDRLRNLTGRMDEVREDERKRLARELHDEVGQTLVAMRMDLAQVEKELPAGLEPISGRLHQMISVAQDSVDLVNRMSTELRSPILDVLGLEAAVESEIWEYNRRWGAEIEVEIDLGGLSVNAQRDMAVYRVLKESLSNVRRHAEASRISVSLRVAGEAVVLQVLDNGIGITDEQVQDPRAFGLIGMQERIQRVGGSIKIARRLEGGTRVIVEVPIASEYG